MNTFHVRKTGDVILLHLGKGDDMLQCLNQAITKHRIKNGAVVSMIGTLDKARYHMIQTTEDDPTNGFYTVEGPIEVAAGQGLIIDGEPHIHICMATPELRIWDIWRRAAECCILQRSQLKNTARKN